jgi:hypothetical protein
MDKEPRQQRGLMIASVARIEQKDGTTNFLAMAPAEVKVRVYGDAAVVTVGIKSNSGRRARRWAEPFA